MTDSAGTCPFCRRPVWWLLTRNRRRMPLDPRPDRGGEWIPLRGRAWEPWELRLAGEPWSDFADGPTYRNHITTCKSWPREAARRRHSTVYLPQLGCHSCGVVDGTVRHVTPDVDLCRDCRPGRPEPERTTTCATGARRRPARTTSTAGAWRWPGGGAPGGGPRAGTGPARATAGTRRTVTPWCAAAARAEL